MSKMTTKLVKKYNITKSLSLEVYKANKMKFANAIIKLTHSCFTIQNNGNDCVYYIGNPHSHHWRC